MPNHANIWELEKATILKQQKLPCSHRKEVAEKNDAAACLTAELFCCCLQMDPA